MEKVPRQQWDKYPIISRAKELLEDITNQEIPEIVPMNTTNEKP